MFCGVKIGVKCGVKRMPPAKATGGVFYVGNSNNIIEWSSLIKGTLHGETIL